MGHLGIEATLAEVRKKYWIVRGRHCVKNFLRNCMICKRLRAQPSQQRLADLPSERITEQQTPFTHIGIDYFGPYYIKSGRSQLKRYGVLFTCMSSRALHIEVAHTLDASSFINVLNRFISRRGRPVSMRSNSGTNFVVASRELRENIHQ